MFPMRLGGPVRPARNAFPGNSFARQVPLPLQRKRQRQADAFTRNRQPDPPPPLPMYGHLLWEGIVFLLFLVLGFYLMAFGLS